MKRAPQFIIIGLLGSLCLTATALAGSIASNATIAHIQLNKDYPNIVFIKLVAAPTGKPSCSNHWWDYTLPLATPLDDKFYASLLTAYAAKSVVDMGGRGVCSEHGEVESLGYITLKG